MATTRQQIMEGLRSAGRSNKQIAAELGIKPKTVRNTFAKLSSGGGRDRAHEAAMATGSDALLRSIQSERAGQ